MVALSNVQKSQLRRKYENLNPVHQGGLLAKDRELQQLQPNEILKIFAQNEANPQKWPAFTDLEDHIRNIAQLKRYGVPVII